MSNAPTIPWLESRRRWPTYSLRTLLEVVFVFGVIFYIWFNRQPLSIIKPDHVLKVDALGTYADAPIKGLYLVDPSGDVSLGPPYGKVHVGGMTGNEAEAAVQGRLKKYLATPDVTVSIAGWRDSWELNRIQELESEIERLKQEKLTDERKLKGLFYDPQGPVPSQPLEQR
jgi:Polysaccharide biosynthesis/export protein